jgi:hypothetical protein
MDEDGKRQLEDAAQALHGAERELIAAMQNFVDAQGKAGKSRSRGRAFDILRQLVQRRARKKQSSGARLSKSSSELNGPRGSTPGPLFISVYQPAREKPVRIPDIREMFLQMRNQVSQVNRCRHCGVALAGQLDAAMGSAKRDRPIDVEVAPLARSITPR